MNDELVSKINWETIFSLLLGVFSLLTSLWFITVLPKLLGYRGALSAWAESIPGMMLSVAAAMTGLSLGILGLRRLGTEASPACHAPWIHPGAGLGERFFL